MGTTINLAEQYVLINEYGGAFLDSIASTPSECKAAYDKGALEDISKMPLEFKPLPGYPVTESGNNKMKNQTKPMPDVITAPKADADLLSAVRRDFALDCSVKIMPLADVTEEEWQAVWPRIPAK